MGVASTAGGSRWESPQEGLNEAVLKIISRKFRGQNDTLPKNNFSKKISGFLILSLPVIL